MIARLINWKTQSRDGEASFDAQPRRQAERQAAWPLLGTRHAAHAGGSSPATFGGVDQLSPEWS